MRKGDVSWKSEELLIWGFAFSETESVICEEVYTGIAKQC